MKRKHKLLACFASAILLASSMAVPTFAASAEESLTASTVSSTDDSRTVMPRTSHSDYGITVTDTGKDGEKKNFDGTPGQHSIEYTNVKMSCLIGTAQCRIELWKKAGIGGQHMPDNQIFTVKSSNRAYWLSCPPENYLIHFVPLNNESTSGKRQPISTLGTFRNY